MANVCVSVPDEMKKEMDGLKKINWSEVARRSFAQELDSMGKLKRLQEITSKSKATDEDVEEIARLVKQGIAERHTEWLGKNAASGGHKHSNRGADNKK